MNQLMRLFQKLKSLKHANTSVRGKTSFIGGAATVEDAKVLQDNLLTLQATEAGFWSFSVTVNKFNSFLDLTTDRF